MALNVIAGASNTGKSESMYNRIMACEKENKQVILFVPSSARIVAEKEYLKYTKKDSIIGTKITSVERFVSQHVNKKELYNNKVYLPELAKKILVKKTIDENAELFTVFAKVKSTSGFVDKLYNYIDRIESQDILTEKLVNEYDIKDLLGAKLAEIINVYNRLNEKLDSKFVTSTNELKSYIEELKNKKQELVNTCVFFDGYNNFNKLEYAYITELLLQGVEVTLVINIDKEKADSAMTEIFNTSSETITKLKTLCNINGIKFNETYLNEYKKNRPEDLEWIGTHIFDATKNMYNKDCNNIEIVTTETTYKEIGHIAEEILKRIRLKGRYEDFVIYTNEISEYQMAIKKVFSEYNIPTYFNVSTNIKKESICIYLLNILKLITEGFGYTNLTSLLQLIKSGLLEIAEKDFNIFENYLKEFGIKGYMLTREFTLNNNEDSMDMVYDLERLNFVRKYVVNLVSNLKDKLVNEHDSKKITEYIYNHLIENGIVSNYEKEIELIKEVNVDEYNKKKQVVPSIYEIMDNIVLAMDSISLNEYVALLDFGMNETIIDTIPEMIDQVEICDINNNNVMPKKFGYIIGAYDKGLPSIQSDDSIFSDIELLKLKKKGIDLKETSEDRNNMQLFNIYKAINRVRTHLTISLPAGKMTGGSLRPSPFIHNIKGILDIKIKATEKTASLNANVSFMNLLTRIAELEDNSDKEQLKELYNQYLAFMDNPKFRKTLEYFRQNKNLNENTLDSIYSDKINSSISKLEQFNRCPFAYFTKYILKLKEKKEYTMSSLDTGSFMHEVIEKFSKYVIERNIAWQDVSNIDDIKGKAITKINSIVEELFEQRYKKYLTSPRYIALKNRLKKSMVRTILGVAESFSQSEFRPLGYEIEFEDGALFAPIEIELSGTKKMYLRGKIDRVDCCKIKDDTYLRIVDYKSSDKNLKLSDVKDGLSLQLMTYMWAMMQNKDKINKEGAVLPAAVTYFTISNNILEFTNYEADEKKVEIKLKKALKLRGIHIRDVEILKKLDNEVENSNESYIEITKRNLINDDKTLPEDVFTNECNNMKKILKEIGKEITGGKVKICPNSKVKNVCEYCEFSTLCRKNILN